MNGVRCFCDFKIFDVFEALFWRIIASTLGHVTCPNSIFLNTALLQLIHLIFA